MKFQLLNPGDRFIYKDEVYTKSTPLVAINEATGNTTLIPRSALLKPLTDSDKTRQSETTLDKNVQANLKRSSQAFIDDLNKILNLAEADQRAVRKLYEEVTTRLIKHS